MSRAISLAKLAKEAEADLDDVLVTLWDAGFDELESPSDIIPANKIAKARSALQIDPPRTQMQVEYWLTQLNIDREEFNQRLLELGVKSLSKNIRMLPKGALRKLRRRYLEIQTTEHGPTKSDKETPLNSISGQPYTPFKWESIGSQRRVQYLSQEEVIAVHDALVTDFATHNDPISPPGLKNRNLLASAIMRPQTGYGNQLKYQTVEMAGAALLHSIVLNHAFHNGNKRTGIVSLLAFLDKNLFLPTCSEKELFKFTLRVAQHRLVPLHFDNLADREVLKIADWIRRNSRKVRKEERPLHWLKLKRILRDYGCHWDTANVGNRIDIYRKPGPRSRFSRKNRPPLHTQVAFRGDGTEAESNTIHIIRQDLELDEDHGIDSRIFYDAEARPDDFIQSYRTLLRRLAQF